jgi:hypothetical protein
MQKTFTHTTWRVKQGQEDEFVKRWEDWIEGSHRQGLGAHALLLRRALGLCGRNRLRLRLALQSLCEKRRFKALLGACFGSADPIVLVQMNRRGHPQTLVPSHPGNVNAVKHGVRVGVHVPR